MCFSTWTTIIGVCCICCLHSATFHMSHTFVGAREISLKVIYCHKLKIIKLPSSGLSPGVTRQTGSLAAMWLTGQLVQNLSFCNEPGGNKGSLITTPKPSCRPEPAPRISCWQPSHSWGHRGEILQPTLPGTISEWTVSDVKTGGTVFLVFWGAVCTYFSATAKNLSFRTRGLLRQLQTQSGRKRNIQSISAWFFLHACSCSGLHLECMA